MFTVRRIVSFASQNLRALVFILLIALASIYIYNSQRITLGPFPLTAKSPNRLIWRQTVEEDVLQVGESVLLLERPDMRRLWDRGNSSLGIVIRAGVCDQASCSLEELIANELDLWVERRRGSNLPSILLESIEDNGIDMPEDCATIAESSASSQIMLIRSRRFALDCGGNQVTITATYMGRQSTYFDNLIEKFVQSIEAVE